MKKTYYTVRRAVWGADRPETMLFATAAEAAAYHAATDYTDKPRTLTLKGPAAIAEYDAIMAHQQADRRGV